MHPDVASAIIGAISAFVVAILTVGVSRINERRVDRARITSKYLSPLRLWAEEAHYRLQDMLVAFPTNRQLLMISNPGDLNGRSSDWFNTAGSYFVSTCYITACLFAAMKRVRESVPYLKLSRKQDTDLLTRILSVSHEYLAEDGISYPVQHSIGEQMWDHDTNRVLTYRQFCEALQEPAQRVWFDPLLRFYADVGNGKRLDQLPRIQNALLELSRLLDAGKAIAARRRVEESRWNMGLNRTMSEARGDQ